MRWTVLAVMAALGCGPALGQTAPVPPAAAPAAPVAAPAMADPAPAAAAAMKPKPKPKKPAGKPGMVMLTVKLTNNRNSPVNSVGFVPRGSETEAKNLLKAPLAPGKSRDIGVETTKGQCLFDVQGNYADDTEIAAAGVDLCKDHRLMLVD